jgi:hypothetical protein
MRCCTTKNTQKSAIVPKHMPSRVIFLMDMCMIIPWKVNGQSFKENPHGR